MERQERKAAIAAYRESKRAAGIYAVRCTATGESWVGRAPDLEAIRNRLWFSLGRGLATNRPMQQRWRQHGPDSFVFDELERLDADLDGSRRERVLRERHQHWRAELAAEAA